MIELFRVATVVPEYRGYKDVCFNWFCSDRREPLVPYAEVIQDYEPDNPYHEHAVDELFTRQEANLLIDYLDRTHPTGKQHLKPVELPFPNDIMGYDAIAVGGHDDFYVLSETPEYSLPFKVWGYFNLMDHGCEPFPSLFVIAP